MKKNLSIKDLKQLKKKSLKSKKKIVLCHGVFDLIHIGHLKHFNTAKKFGDILVVSITSDSNVKKGPGRPIFSEKISTERHKSGKIKSPFCAISCSRNNLIPSATIWPLIGLKDLLLLYLKTTAPRYFLPFSSI